LRCGVKLRVFAKCHGDRAQMIMSRAVLVHVTRCSKSVERRGAEQTVFRAKFTITVVRVAAFTRQTFVSMEAQNRFAEAGVDRRRRKLDHQARCGTPGGD